MLPAFPTLPEHGFVQGMPGMTLRDFFAAMAMQSLITEGAGCNAMPGQINPMCATAYDWADAMLKAREA